MSHRDERTIWRGIVVVGETGTGPPIGIFDRRERRDLGGVGDDGIGLGW
jgi:hypothetical protein